MSLSGYLPETQAVSWTSGGQVWSVTVRGLTLPDLTTLIASRVGDLDEAIVLWNAAKTSVYSHVAMQRFLQTLIMKAPGLVAQTIALSSGEPDLAATYETIPFGSSMQALAGIVELTLKEVSGLKNLQAALAAAIPQEVLESLDKQIKTMTPSSTTGGFEKTLASFSLKGTLTPTPIP